MLIFQRIGEGKILYQKYSEQELELPLNIALNTNIQYENSKLVIKKSGDIFFDLEDYPSLVFEVKNNFVPTTTTELGGISITKNEREYNLFEYDGIQEDKDYQYVGVIKKQNIFYGYGNTTNNWYSDDYIDKGSIYLKNAETVGIKYIGVHDYGIDEIKIYKDTNVIFEDVEEDKDFNIVNKTTHQILVSAHSKGNKVSIQFPYYPFNPIDYEMQVKEDNTLIDTYEIYANELWGGDIFRLTTPVILLDENKNPVSVIDDTYLGRIKDESVLSTLLYLRSLSDNNLDVTLIISENTNGYDWTFLSKDTQRGKKLDIRIPAKQDVDFNLEVVRPEDYVVSDKVFSKYKIYLEVQ